MARKKPTKTDAIRKAFKKTGSPLEVVALLKKQGIKVTPQYVSTIKASDKRKAAQGGRRRGPGRPPGSKAKANGSDTDLKATSELLGKAVDLVMQCGGEDEAKRLISTAASLISKVR